MTPIQQFVSKLAGGFLRPCLLQRLGLGTFVGPPWPPRRCRRLGCSQRRTGQGQQTRPHALEVDVGQQQFIGLGFVGRAGQFPQVRLGRGGALTQCGAQVAHGAERLRAGLLQGLEQRLFQRQAGLFIQATRHCKGVRGQIQQRVAPGPQVGRVRAFKARQLLNRLVGREQFGHQSQLVPHGAIGLLQHRQQGLLDDAVRLGCVARVGWLQTGKRLFTALHQHGQRRTATSHQRLRAHPQGSFDGIVYRGRRRPR